MSTDAPPCPPRADDDQGRARLVEGLGLTWFRQTSVDEVWSATWLKHRTEFRTLHH